MRILQIIDSLEPGGSERMAVNYANSLAEKIGFSGLIATRNEGLLLDQLDKKVSYLFLNKKKRIDLKAILKLRKYIKNNKIDVIHAHSSSFFIAVLVKLTFLRVKIIWHDHYGISQDLGSRKNLMLKFGSFFFAGSIAVNSALKTWAENYLWCSNVTYFSNFIGNSSNADDGIQLMGEEGKRIICVANLRPQKNHNLLIDAAVIIKNKFPDWSFHLFGKDFKDAYSLLLSNKVKNLKLQKTIYFYGAVDNVKVALKQSDIAVLPSLSEGLPLALLEYGLYKLPVVVTSVGEIPMIITSEEGSIVESNNLKEFSEALEKLILNKELREEKGLKLYNKIKMNYTEEIIVDEYLLWLSFINFAR
ncbi:glycosyltransferase [Flavobacterium daemonense]|uniref:glycosyltransferase n=1 Tax=Flavobacterium daemonense TaxID=1393049 RepID=UPI0011857547|nr:glycosyltransferase [Flavobacterium daemonense]KAF2333101.1 glycosyltransferase [Flavobacterium daemonense]